MNATTINTLKSFAGIAITIGFIMFVIAFIRGPPSLAYILVFVVYSLIAFIVLSTAWFVIVSAIRAGRENTF